MTNIFDYPDMCREIFKKLDFATISAIAPVCKLFAEIAKECYEEKLQEEIILPSKALFEDFKPTMYYWMGRYYISTRDSFIDMLIRFERFTKPFIDEEKQYWVALVNDFEMMETIFLFIAHIENLLENVKWIWRFYPRYKDVPERNDMYLRLQDIFDILDTYMYVDYPSKYNVDQLRSMAKFKKVKKYSTLNRAKLINALKRPKNEVYYLR